MQFEDEQMKIAIIYNKDLSSVINTFGIQNKEKYNPKTVKLVANALETAGHNVAIIDGNMDVIDSLQHFMPKVMDGERMGMVFNMAYGIQGESRYTHLPSMLEMLGIPYVGSTPSGHALALDKVITKIIMQKNNIPTPHFWVYSSADEDMSDVIYPVIVKPKMEAVSFGLRVVYDQQSLKEAVDYILNEFSQQALVEQFIRGREFAVGLIGNNPVEAFPVLEIDLENDPDAIQSADDKRKTPRGKICPADLSKTLKDEMVRWSIAAFRALQLRDFARVDIRLDENNNVYLLEVNSMASLGRTGSYSFAANVAGYDYNALVNKMLDVAAVRYFANSAIVEQEEMGVSRRLPFHVRIRGFLRNRQPRIEMLLKKLININTFVRNVEGVNKMAQLLSKELSLLGFTLNSFPQVEVGNIQYYSNTNDENIDILIMGNLDNLTKLSNQKYYKETEQRIYGTGVWEHKGGLVTLIAALQGLRFVRQIKKIKIGILLTSDDSLQGRFAKSCVEKFSKNARVVLGMHGAFVDGGVVTSRSGSARYKFNMQLVNTESAENVAFAVNVYTHLIHSWTKLSNPNQGLLVTPHSLDIDSSLLEPSAVGEAILSIRFNDSMQFEKLDATMKKMIHYKKYANLLHFEFEGGIRRPSMKKTAQIEKVWKVVKSVADRLDIRLREEHRWSTSDICFVEDDKAKISGLGPVGAKPAGGAEYILRHSLLERAALLAVSILELNKKLP